MHVYLIQHGDAVEESVDPERPLSKKGITDIEAVGHFLEKAHISVLAIWHSGKTRARQTAERLASHLTDTPAIEEKHGLNPHDKPRVIFKELQSHTGDVAIVGHLPHLAAFAAELLTDDEETDLVAFQKGCVVCLERDKTERWRVKWMVIPSLLTP